MEFSELLEKKNQQLHQKVCTYSLAREQLVHIFQMDVSEVKHAAFSCVLLSPCPRDGWSEQTSKTRRVNLPPQKQTC